jgi:adenosylmethionine-8-amino-7-oxononanoate aminotransferase
MPTIVSGDGCHLTDDRGRRLIDVCSGPFLALLGQGNERVITAMSDQARRLSYTYSKSTRHGANAGLSARLARLGGPGLDRVHLTSGGSEANEMAVKLLRCLALTRGQPERTVLISLNPGYHGATVHTLGMNGDLAGRATWDPLTIPSRRIPAPLAFRAPSARAAADASIDALDDLLDEVGGDRVLALMMEPIGGQATGVNVPDPSFAQRIRSRADEHGFGLVFDEVVTAFRTGAFLAAHHDPSARPDLVTLAKGLGAGYAPLGAVLAPEALVAEVAAGVGFQVSHSYDANPIACAVGSAVLDEVVDRDLVSRGAELGVRLRAGLREIAATSPLIGDIRGRGALLAVEIVADADTLLPFPATVDPGAALVRRGLDVGLLLYSRRQNQGRYGDWLLVAPPLVMDDDTADTMLDRLGSVLAGSADDLRGAAPKSSLHPGRLGT